MSRLGSWRPVALLVIAMVMAIGTIVWVLRLAITHERLVVEKQLTTAYDGYLRTATIEIAEAWERKVASLRELVAEGDEAAAVFEKMVLEGMAESLVVYDVHGEPSYPSLTLPSSGDLPSRHPDADAVVLGLSEAFEQSDWNLALSLLEGLEKPGVRDATKRRVA